MIHPDNISVTRLKDEGPNAVFKASCQFDTELLVPLEMLQDHLSAEQMMELVRLDAKKQFHAVVYGELLKPFGELISIAKHCPPNYQRKLEQVVTIIGALLLQPNETQTTDQNPT